MRLRPWQSALARSAARSRKPAESRQDRFLGDGPGTIVDLQIELDTLCRRLVRQVSDFQLRHVERYRPRRFVVLGNHQPSVPRLLDQRTLRVPANVDQARSLMVPPAPAKVRCPSAQPQRPEPVSRDALWATGRKAPTPRIRAPPIPPAANPFRDGAGIAVGAAGINGCDFRKRDLNRRRLRRKTRRRVLPLCRRFRPPLHAASASSTGALATGSFHDRRVLRFHFRLAVPPAAPQVQGRR